jgi:hypothetical protein
MDTVAVQRLGDDLSEYVADVFASLRYAGWQDRAGHYLRGLMLDGRRKSIQPMAARLHGPHEQALNHFVARQHRPGILAEMKQQAALQPAVDVMSEAALEAESGFAGVAYEGFWSVRVRSGVAGRMRPPPRCC